ncbi:2'-5' RNA ligase family protein [Chitinophaga nivalis]|uniref:2'-5' RNA ligase family protein n=1 Tax=Chitinophaga nivalis TaxID=2991709 RepID=A0ABT3IPS9_9BACT|nr:2'-5' RNA ligase family protein [Chitinophaga nivalis]MCW3464338.1 2'-5' RNA ligase family protein [Chitinophaga nivalis]MCW3485971.1 2'-5' RNA ligase family protein [Chitinophaga nivalis]
MNTNYEISEELFDYLLVVNPDVLVAKDVTRMRQFIANELNDPGHTSGPVHVALFRSAFPVRYENDFITMLEEVARKQAGFAIYTAKMDAARHADGRHSIFVNVANPKPLMDLHRSIMETFELKPQSFRPHIMLARGMQEADVNKIGPLLAEKLFVRSFNCHCFSLLRRPAAGGKYERVRDFVFGDIEHMAGSLFNYAA